MPLFRSYKKAGFPNRDMHRFPNIVNIEVYRGSCPCACRHCPVGQIDANSREERFGRKAIDKNLYLKIISEISKHPHTIVRLHSVGEPLDSPNFKDLLDLHQPDANYWLFTSAVTRDRDMLELICRKVDIVEVSVNSTSRSDYRSTKGIDAFELVSENIRFMHQLIIDNGLNTRLIVSRVQSEDRQKDLDFVAYWKESGLVADAFVRSYHTYNDLLNPMDEADTSGRHEPCLVHWGRFNISLDGYAVVCFNELFRKELNRALILGDINRQTIKEIWHGQALTAIRKAELSGVYPDSELFNNLPCVNCVACQPLFGTRQTSEHQMKEKGILN